MYFLLFKQKQKTGRTITGHAGQKKTTARSTDINPADTDPLSIHMSPAEGFFWLTSRNVTHNSILYLFYWHMVYIWKEIKVKCDSRDVRS